jgi:aspartyl-tRNA(Asn)/glutamyl-tRNA(Gln) amidotransferase subunit A
MLAEVVEETLRLYEVLRKYEAYAVHREFLETQPDKYQPVVRQRALLGAEITQSQYEDARAGQLAVRESALRLFDEARLIRTPAIDGVVPRWADLGPEHRDAFTRWSTPFNVLGWPAITAPVAGDGVAPVGGAGSGTELRAGVATRATTLPASVQFAAPPGEDLALLDAAQQFLTG